MNTIHFNMNHIIRQVGVKPKYFVLEMRALGISKNTPD